MNTTDFIRHSRMRCWSAAASMLLVAAALSPPAKAQSRKPSSTLLAAIDEGGRGSLTSRTRRSLRVPMVAEVSGERADPPRLPAKPEDDRGRTGSATGRVLKISGLTLLVAGSVALIPGISLLAIDGNDTGRTKPGLKEIYDTKAGGAAMLGAGLTAAITGAVLLYLGSKLQRRVKVGVTPTRGGAWVSGEVKF